MRSFQPVERKHHMMTRSQVKSETKIRTEEKSCRYNPYAIQYKTPSVKTDPGYFVPSIPLNQSRQPDNNQEIWNQSKHNKIEDIERQDTTHGSSNDGVNHDVPVKRGRGRPRKRALPNDAVVGSSATTLPPNKIKIKKDSNGTYSAHQVIVSNYDSALSDGTEEVQEVVESPPPTPPPKRRRQRQNKSRAPLKEAKILESKLRNTSPRKVIPNMQPRTKYDENNNVKINSPILSPEAKSESKSDRFHSMLDSIEWKFSFESAPKNEPYFRTFSRQEKPACTVLPAPEAPVVLPYETDSVCPRPQRKVLVPTRKSPRCHPPSSAIVAALKPRKRKTVCPRAPPTSVAASSLPTEPKTAQSLPLQSELSPASPKCAQLEDDNQNLLSTLPSLSGNPSTSTASSQPQMPTELVPWIRTEDLSSELSLVSYCESIDLENILDEFELPAHQYVFDPMQVLSDPTMVRILAAMALYEKGIGSQLTM